MRLFTAGLCCLAIFQFYRKMKHRIGWYGQIRASVDRFWSKMRELTNLKLVKKAREPFLLSFFWSTYLVKLIDLPGQRGRSLMGPTISSVSESSTSFRIKPILARRHILLELRCHNLSPSTKAFQSGSQNEKALLNSSNKTIEICHNAKNFS